MQAHFCVSCAVLAQDSQGRQLCICVVPSRARREMISSTATAVRSSQLPAPYSGTINTGFHPSNEFSAAV